MNERYISNLAHRGASEYAPENTMAAFYKAVELGANGIETDLKISRDGVILLLHDEKLDRTTNGTGKASEYTWAELRGLDAGSWFSPRYEGERLVELEQFLHGFGAKSLHFALEFKERGIEKQTLEMIRAYDVKERVTLTSFIYEELVAARAIDADIRIGYLVKTFDEQAIEQVKAIDGTQICPRCSQLTPENVLLAKSRGLEVRAWGVADEEWMHHALRCGVDGMTINFPDKLAASLGKSAL
ncbi:Glycerophosphodiester phosphodiesterase [Paenibacillus solanacearum]|uniref:Glycerophosphodiester phosphodiesterase n=1 Tax=Paenibacillus solanacearum TaxID=2048548 RepID=A0A916K0H5_9BACL|nr:glycerophosphodiester phosphodiesterase family protein [Paenibacillus solanacearum]CAG7622301.1 Glycerophosphodiester phosphodiesterase [Paenibacillus solanacearum]